MKWMGGAYPVNHTGITGECGRNGIDGRRNERNDTRQAERLDYIPNDGEDQT